MAVRMFLLFGILVVIMVSCRFPMLGLQLQAYKGQELRLDGYYYRNNYSFKDDIWVKIFFFYKNGVVLNGSSSALSSLGELEERFKNGSYHSWNREYRTTWGVHRIEGDKIQFEVWIHRGGALRLDRLVRTGKILNDSTFVINRILIRGDVRYPMVASDTFHFKEFSPKPDSTNSFIVVQ